MDHHCYYCGELIGSKGLTHRLDSWYRRIPKEIVMCWLCVVKLLREEKLEVYNGDARQAIL